MTKTCATLLLAICTAAAQPRAAIESYVTAHQGQIVRELVELLSIPNIAADRPNIRRNAEYLGRMLRRHGLQAEILETAGNPLVWGERKAAGTTRTVLYYIHYDGQPVDRTRWKQDDPFRPILRAGRMEENAREVPDFARLEKFEDAWRLYARSASDDKAPIVAFCAALDALRAAGREPAANIRVILDGEEEAGSPSITSAIDRYRDRLRADLLLILDGPTHAGGKPTLAFGARGNVTMDVTVYGPRFALHSGHYGNWAPNPGIELARLLATMKDDRGRVTIDGFYDGIPPLTNEERRILNAVPDDLSALQKLFGIARPEAVGESLQEAIQYPSLNVRGMRSGYVGAEARTIIPADATAALDIRLIQETPAAQMAAKVLAHIRKQGFHVVDSDPDDTVRLRYPRIAKVTAGDATEAYRTPLDAPESQMMTAALRKMWGEEPVRLRTMGGTVPISQFIRTLGFPAISLPIVNFDNNQHSENENLRLGHLWRGIVSVTAVLSAGG